MIDKIARRNFLKSGLAVGALSSIDGFSPASSATAQTTATAPNTDDRQTWIEILTRVSNPLLHALSERKLKATMPVECPQGNVEERKQFVYLEATARLLPASHHGLNPAQPPEPKASCGSNTQS